MVNDMLSFQLKDMRPMNLLERCILVERTVERFRGAMVKEHDPVGVNSALTVGENLVQSSLGAKHTAGLKRGATGFDRVEEITNMKNKSDIVKLITTPVNGVPRSREEINELANMIIRIHVDDIKKDEAIMTLDASAVTEGNVLNAYPPWYKAQLAIRALAESQLGTMWLRIYIDKDKMYRHRITLPTLVSNIQENMGARGIVLYSPIALDSYIDVHTIADRTEAQYMQRLGYIAAIQVGGITSVSNAHAIFENLLTNLNIAEVANGEFEVKSAAPVYVPSYAWENMLSAMVPDYEPVGSSGRRFYSSENIDRLKQMIL